MAQDVIIIRGSFNIGATVWQVVLIVEPEEFLFENGQLVLDILDISTESGFNIDGLAPANLR